MYIYIGIPLGDPLDAVALSASDRRPQRDAAAFASDTFRLSRNYRVGVADGLKL